MNSVPRVMADRIRGEIEDLDRAQARALLRWEHALRNPDDQEAYLESTALNLQSFYTGLERVFSLVAEQVDGVPPTGDAWHRVLLARMAEGVPGVRPPIISSETALDLDRLMRFRHLVRNIYAEKLLPAEMASMMDGLSRLWNQLKAELSGFAELLEH